MKAFEVGPQFGLENLKIIERPPARPGPGEVLVKIRAVSLNFRDHLMVQGKYNPRQTLPLVPLSDGAGIVSAVGSGVDRWKEGDRVCPIFAQRWHSGPPSHDTLRFTLGGPLDGTLREEMVVPADALVSIPSHLTYEEASTLPCAALTAWSSLVTQGAVKAGDTVVALGTGGVSVFALQFARLMGARVIITSGDDDKLQRAKEIGAHGLINYRSTPEWEKQIRKLTSGELADHIIETGGAGTLEKSIRSVRPGGFIGLIGVLAGGQKDLDLTPVFMRNIRVQGILVGHRESFEAMNRAIDLHGLKPIIDRVFSFQESTEALRYLASAKHFGKIVIRVSD